jgi:hypothetical protein
MLLWRVLRKSLHLKAYKLFIVQHSPHSNIRNTIAKLFLKHPVEVAENSINWQVKCRQIHVRNLFLVEFAKIAPNEIQHVQYTAPADC